MTAHNNEISNHHAKGIILVPVNDFESCKPDNENKYISEVTFQIDITTEKNAEALEKFLKNIDDNDLIFENLRTGEFFRIEKVDIDRKPSL